MPNSTLRDCIPFDKARAALISRVGDFTDEELEAALALMDLERVEILRRFIMGS